MTAQALRRDVFAADRFPEDVLELQGYLTGHSRVDGVDAVPGKGTDVPLYVLGSSLYGAQLAAMLGLPYAFASHFAPQALEQAVATYRREFRPSAQLPEPYVIAGVNVLAADTEDRRAGAPRQGPTRPGRPLRRTWRRAHRRAGRRDPRVAAGPPPRDDDALHRGRDAAPRRAVPRRLRDPRRRPTSSSWCTPGRRSTRACGRSNCSADASGLVPA